jgi:hypothetical protein
MTWHNTEQGKELYMSTVEKILRSIESLSEEEYARLREWFSERDWEKWDRQIKADSESGKLDFLIKEARDEKAKGKLKEL